MGSTFHMLALNTYANTLPTFKPFRAMKKKPWTICKQNLDFLHESEAITLGTNSLNDKTQGMEGQAYSHHSQTDRGMNNINLPDVATS